MRLVSRILRVLDKNLLLCVIAIALALSCFAPGPGLLLKSWKLATPLVVFIFVLQGAAMAGGSFARLRDVAAALVLGFIVAFAASPGLGYVVTRCMPLSADNALGFLLICSMCPTVVTGVVMSARARGDHGMALLLTVVLCISGVVMIPLILSTALSAIVSVNRTKMFADLLVTVLAPALAGYGLRAKFPGFVGRHAKFVKNAPVYLLGLLIYTSLAAQSHQLSRISVAMVGLLVVPSLAVHALLVVAGYGAARYGVRMPEGKCRSLAIVCGQKSLALAIPIWSTAFAAAHPLALIPPIIFHFTQIVADGFLANYWERRPSDL